MSWRRIDGYRPAMYAAAVTQPSTEQQQTRAEETCASLSVVTSSCTTTLAGMFSTTSSWGVLFQRLGHVRLIHHLHVPPSQYWMVGGWRGNARLDVDVGVRGRRWVEDASGVMVRDVIWKAVKSLGGSFSIADQGWKPFSSPQCHPKLTPWWKQWRRQLRTLMRQQFYSIGEMPSWGKGLTTVYRPYNSYWRLCENTDIALEES
ncbi:hypothetical protein EDB89DRAFT_2244550 [Lactarius sanguifluus]|nr:hypothetical protein EDB89DRAFT_2244550 [Lactarius sanguifluus]